ncbi:MAG: hypothetical protein H0W50_05790 [Parachlamydiaceae bacterium]|nr:hypothetical protein [Parachlamydiaceae bacterium]
MDSNISRYLQGEQKFKEGIGPRPEDTKINNVSKKEMEQLKSLKNEGLKFTKTKGKLIKIKRNVSWKSVDVTPKEATKFQKSLWAGGEKVESKSAKYPLPSWTGGKRGELGELLEINLKPKDDEILGNGKTLSSAEAHAIYIYSTNNYLLINGTLDNDSTSLKQWVDAKLSKEEDKSLEKQKAILNEGKSHVNEIAKLAASGINKLPSYEGQLYRGDGMTGAKLDEWRNGKIMVTTKFFSCSSKVEIGEKFARENAIGYMEDKKEEYKPVLYVFNSQNAKDIKKYSEKEEEDERIYNPGQAFRSVGVDETTVPGLAIIFMEEIN